MKRMFFAVCGMLPGGFLLLAVMVLFIGCAYTTYNNKTGVREVKGYGTIMEIAAAEDLQANAEVKRAEAKCIAERGMAACYYGNYFAPPEEVAWKRFLTQREGSAPVNRKPQDDLREIKKSVMQIRKSQEHLIEAVNAK